MEDFLSSESEKSISLKGSLQRKRMSFQYFPSGDNTEDLKSRDHFFSSINKFSISPDPSCTILLLKSLLLRVENKNDLSFFKEAIREDSMDLEIDSSIKNIKLCLTINEKELADDMLLSEINCGSSEPPVIKFSFSSSNAACEYIFNKQEIYKNFLDTCCSVGVEADNPSYPYLRFINLLYQSSYHYPFLLQSIHISSLRQPLTSYIIPKLNSIALKHFEEPLSLSRRSLPQ